MYRAPSKRRQLIARVAVYASMTTGVILLVTFLVFIMLGYRFNRDTSTIEQGGLVQFASRPIDSNVSIGRATLTDLTPSKITVNPGDYDVSMTKKGYLPWKKSVDVRAGEVLWLNYAQLVPEKVETEQLTKLDAASDVTSSPNGDRFAVIGDPKSPTITFVDVTGEMPKLTTISIPSSVLRAGTTPTITFGDWASDSDRFMVNATYDDGGIERLVVDRRDAAETLNISTAYEADVTEALFDPRSSERLIIRTSKGDVRTIDTSSGTLSSIIASTVTSMSVYDNDALLLVQRVSDTEQSVGYMSFGTDTVRSIKKVTSSERVLVAAAEYFSEPHIAIAVGTQLEVYKVPSLPSSESGSPISLSSLSSSVLPAPADFLTVRSSGRFVFAQYASGVTTYDIELSKQTQTAFSIPTTTEIRWLDKYHFYLTTGTSLEVMEFDGANPHAITGLKTQFDALQSDNGEFIYSINQSEVGFSVQRSRVILEN